MKWTDVYKIIMSVLATGMLSVLVYIALTLKEVPIIKAANNEWHSEERRLREDRDNGLQRQISELRGLLFEYEHEKAKEK
jgi:hypothetical protein